MLQTPGAKAASTSVVKIYGTACGLGIQGSGWVVRRDLVATNAHVIAGEHDTNAHRAERAVCLGAQSSTWIHRTTWRSCASTALRTPPLAIDGERRLSRGPSCILGYPRDGALAGRRGDCGRAEDGDRTRRLRPQRRAAQRRSAAGARCEPGESGGPVVDSQGGVVAMIFGGAKNGGNGFAVPVSVVRDALPKATQPVSSGPCID